MFLEVNRDRSPLSCCGAVWSLRQEEMRFAASGVAGGWTARGEYIAEGIVSGSSDLNLLLIFSRMYTIKRII